MWSAMLTRAQLHGKHVIDAPLESEGPGPGSEVKGEAQDHTREAHDHTREAQDPSESVTTRTHLARALLGVLQWYGETLAPLSWTLHSDTGHVELHADTSALVDDANHVQCVLAPVTKHNVAASATSLPTVFAHWAALARDLRGGKALDHVVWCRSEIGSYNDKLTRVTQLIGEKRTREETGENDHVTKRPKIDSE